MVQALNTKLFGGGSDADVVRNHALPFSGKSRELDSLIELIGDADFALIGEASHGTHEFYKTRAQLTTRLIEERGFNAVCAEADWPDAWRVNRFIHGTGFDTSAEAALSGFQRFPTWMWRNTVVVQFLKWMRHHNMQMEEYADKVGFFGLDLYSLYSSIFAVVNYLEKTNPEAAQRARERYACLEQFGTDEQAYGYAASLGLTRDCEDSVVAELVELRKQEAQYIEFDGRVGNDEYFFVKQNALLVRNAEEYYREMFKGRVNTWNLRDTHMIDTLANLREHYEANGKKLKAVVWAHNSHLGDASATQMGDGGEVNVGQLARERFGPGNCCLIGFTGYAGTVTAASAWGGPAENKKMVAGMKDSYEALFHEVGMPAFILPLKARELRRTLGDARLERAIGVIYMPQTERWSHYFFSRLPQQFQAIVHFDNSHALQPLERNAEWGAQEFWADSNID